VKHGDLLGTKIFLPVDQFLDSMSTVISEWEGVQKKKVENKLTDD